ncbi:hypothetical protein [Streptomyces noursei]|uniref:hypothetical protein n=1 Tax=Streptomyces noursei TaxID=1971 RepID=UPI001CA4C1B7|nr:hypothetical protein [Streptomyces noursei]
MQTIVLLCFRTGVGNVHGVLDIPAPSGELHRGRGGEGGGVGRRACRCGHQTEGEAAGGDENSN